MFDRLRRRKLNGNGEHKFNKSSGTLLDKSQATEYRPLSEANIAPGSPVEADSAQDGKRDLSHPTTTKTQNYRKRFSWSDNSNARSTASSTSNDDDLNNVQSATSGASRWRYLSTPNGLRNLGTRFSWSDSSQSKISVTSISEDEDNLMAGTRSPDPAHASKPPTRRSTPGSNLHTFNRKLSRNDKFRDISKQKATSKQEKLPSTENQSAHPTVDSHSSTSRRLSKLKEFSVVKKGVSSNKLGDAQRRSSTFSKSSADISNVGLLKTAENVPQRPNQDPVTTDKLQSFQKRHSWAAPGLNKVPAVQSGLLNTNGSTSLGPSAPIQTVVIRRPSAADRQDSVKRISWSQINEERSKALSILEEGSSSSQGRSLPNTTSTPKPIADRRPSTTDKLEAFKKRHSLSDYKQLRGRPVSGPDSSDLVPARTWSPGIGPRGPSPPRRTSTSDRVRSFSKRLSNPNNIWGPSADSGVVDDGDIDPAVTKIVSSETFQLRGSNITPLPSHFPQPAHMTPQSSPLLSLPTEILQHLPPYLPPSAVVSLRQTCSRLHTVLGLLPHSSSSSLSPSSMFAFLLMLDRDSLTAYAPSPPPRLLCGNCRRFHLRSAFPTSHVSLHPLHRSCQQLWLCPHKSYTHPRAAKLLRPPQDSNTLFITKNIDPCPRCRDFIRHRVASDPTNTILTTKIALLQRPTPSPRRGQAPDVFPVRDVSAALQALNFQICPHIRISDHLLLSRFCRVCLSTRSMKANGRCIQDCNSERLNATTYSGGKCKGQCFKKGCNTGWMFQARESLKPGASGRRQVWLVLGIWRGLGKLKIPDDDDIGVEEIMCDPDEEEGDEKKGATPITGPEMGIGDKDPAWLSHTVDVPERAAMRKHLEEWNRGAGGGGKCLPDWSICLLHPEDGGLGIGAV